MKGLQGGGAFSHFIKSGRAPSSDCSSKSLGLAVAPLRSAPHRAALRRLADKKREHYDSTVKYSQEKCASEPFPNPDPSPNQAPQMSLKDVQKRHSLDSCALIGIREICCLCVKEYA